MSDEQKPGPGKDQEKIEKSPDEKPAEDKQKLPPEGEAGDKDDPKSPDEKSGDEGDDEKAPSEDEQDVFEIGSGAIARIEGEEWLYTDPDLEKYGRF
mgnify:CR=1 FL=1